MANVADLNDVHRLFYLGVVEIALGMGCEAPLGPTSARTSTADAEAVEMTANSSDGVRSIEERIIDQLDNAQLCNRITRRPDAESAPVAVHVSTNGVKLLETTNQRAVERLAMHKIVQCLSYENELGSYNVAIVVVKTEGGHQAHLLQTESADEADHLCQQVREAFTELDRGANSRAQDERERSQHHELLTRNGAPTASTNSTASSTAN
ncbi:PID domain-containing protein [Aphelenchoides besseyi]|nr:PID domain-containing protein [Aphelenchoides besseyi]